MTLRREDSIDLERRALSIALPVSVAGLGTLALPFSAQGQPRPKLDVPYVPTPMEVVQAMLNMASVGSKDTVYDLGCGDGRIVITAAKERGARGVGVDIDPERIAEANRNAKAAGVHDRVKFRRGDLFKSNFAPATVVMLYLLPELNIKLRPQLWRQLRVGTRVVSHAFDMGDDWLPERTERIGGKVIYGWTITDEHKKAA